MHVSKEAIAFALMVAAVVTAMYIFFVAGLDSSAQSTKAKLQGTSS